MVYESTNFGCCVNSIVIVQKRNKFLQSVAINYTNLDDLFILKLENLLDHPVQFLKILISHSKLVS